MEEKRTEDKSKEKEKEKSKSDNGAPRSHTMIVTPATFLKHLFGRVIVVKLKWGMEYSGTLSCADAYMNLQLRDAEESIEGESQGIMSKLVIRCNNILYIREKVRESSDIIQD